MAPSPENDSAPKAPDKNDKAKGENITLLSEPRPEETDNTSTTSENKEAAVSGLDDGQLKALLDEAINYKSPKDRHGKSKLFQNLLDEAEEDDRKARATSASGSELVRYYNRTAATTRRNRHCRQPSSVSENLTHGGSLNNLAMEELYEAASHLSYKPSKTVSARQRQGGSLPCNVNAGVTPSYDKQFFDEARKKKENQKVEYTAIDMESESLLKHDSLNENYPEIDPMAPKIPRVKYTTSARFEITPSGSNTAGVDDPVQMPLDRCEKNSDSENYNKSSEAQYTTTSVFPSHYSLLNLQGAHWPFSNYRKPLEEKRVDENGNALGQSVADTKKNKKKKVQAADKNVVVLEAKDVAGHRSDIINDLDKLMEYIGVDDPTGTKSKSNVHKSKLHKHHFSGSNDDKNQTNKKRVRSKGKNEELQKSTSMEEISITKLGDFSFSQEAEGTKVPLRTTKSNSERPRERRSWGSNSEQIQLQNLQLYANASAENLETAEFRVVTKKKSKRRRNSVNGRRQQYLRDGNSNEFNRVLSPEPRRKSACSVPHSEKSNDSSDEDSVKSLPIDTDRINITSENLNLRTYADIAKNNDRPKWNRPPSERKTSQPSMEKNVYKNVVEKNIEKVAVPIVVPTGKVVVVSETENKVTESCQDKTKAKICSVTQSIQACPKLQVNAQNATVIATQTQNMDNKSLQNVVNNVSPPSSVKTTLNSPPDVNNMQNWPTIQNNNNNKNSQTDKVSNKSSQIAASKTNKSFSNNIKNLKNAQNPYPVNKNSQCQNNVVPHDTNQILVHEPVDILVSSEQICMNNVQVLPHNIPDVQTIEKMHFKQLQAHNKQMYMNTPPNNLMYVPNTVQEIMGNHIPVNMCPLPVQNVVHHNVNNNNNNIVQANMQQAVLHDAQSLMTNQTFGVPLNEVKNVKAPPPSAPISDNCDRTSSRPAVVILSGDTKEVSGLTFGFEINEQLLSDDVCDTFTARFFVPDIFQNHNHDKIVNFIGLAWEDIINNQTNGKVQYYNEPL